MSDQKISKVGMATSWLTVGLMVHAIRHNQGCRRNRKLQVKPVSHENAGGAGA